MLEHRSLFHTGLIFMMGFAAGVPNCWAANVWGGSVAVTSDYLVRGVSRSNDQAALQLDLHYFNSSGFIAGLFASSTRIDPSEPWDGEISGFLGLTWHAGDDWRGKLLATHYSYPWNRAGSQYNYDELDAELIYRDWVGVSAIYSPDTPRFYPGGMLRAAAESVEMNLQHAVAGKLSAIGGIGYSHFAGPAPRQYTYWSIGAAYDLAPVFLTVSYADTSAAAKVLFYNAAAGGRWTGTVIWRF